MRRFVLERFGLTGVVIVGLLLAACGSDGSDETTGGKEDTTFQPPDQDVTVQPGQDTITPADVPVGPPPQCENALQCPDDGNPCTVATCEGGLCGTFPAEGLYCDDADPCTLNDACLQGTCKGTPMQCEDGNACTIDTCVKGQCKTKVDEGEQCRLVIQVDEPARGAALTGFGEVTVAGKVISPAGPLESFTINESSVSVGAGGAFEVAFEALAGINVLSFQATDSLGRADKTVRSFLFAEEYSPVGSMGAPTLLPASGQAYLRADVWDDDDTKDVDDMATAVYKVVNNLDVEALIPSPLMAEGEASLGWCEWTVDVSQVSYTLDEVDIKPTTGGIILSGTLTGFQAYVDATAPDWFCPDAHGWVHAEEIYFESWIDVAVSGGNIQFDVVSVDVEITGVWVDMDGGIASLFDWLVNWFSEDLAAKIAQKLEEALPQKVVPLLTSTLNAFLDKTQQFEVPAIPGTKGPMTLVLKAEPAKAEFDSGGAAFVVNLGVGAQKQSSHEAPGTFLRGDCLGEDPGTFNLPESQKVEAAVSEDLLNQILFAAWWGGQMDVTLDDSTLGDVLTDYGITELSVVLTPYLPPVYTTCTPTGNGEFQMGDLHIDATFKMTGQPSTMELFASARAEVDIVVLSQPSGKELALTVGQMSALGLDVIDAGGMVEGGEDLMEQLLSDLVVNVLLKTWLAGVVASYPIPEVDLGSYGTYFPQGTIVTFEPLAAEHEKGFLLLSGSVK